MFRVIDAHAHLAEMTALDDVIRRAGNLGVVAIVSMGTNLKSNMRSLQLAEEYASTSARVLPALGLHPWDLAQENVEAAILHMKQNARASIGIGEVGLDYWLKDVRRGPEKRQFQKTAFEQVLMLARQFDKPVTIHSRGAWDDCYDMVLASGVNEVIFHWFSGPIPLLRKIVDQGFFVSATPAITYSKDHRAAILETPLENLLLETDSPVQYGDLSSEPKDVLLTLNGVAELKGVAPDKIAEITTENFLSLYNVTL